MDRGSSPRTRPSKPSPFRRRSAAPDRDRGAFPMRPSRRSRTARPSAQRREALRSRTVTPPAVRPGELRVPETVIASSTRTVRASFPDGAAAARAGKADAIRAVSSSVAVKDISGRRAPSLRRASPLPRTRPPKTSPSQTMRGGAPGVSRMSAVRFRTSRFPPAATSGRLAERSPETLPEASAVRSNRTCPPSPARPAWGARRRPMFLRDTPLAEPRAARRGPEVPAPPRKSADRARDASAERLRNAASGTASTPPDQLQGRRSSRGTSLTRAHVRESTPPASRLSTVPLTEKRPSSLPVPRRSAPSGRSSRREPRDRAERSPRRSKGCSRRPLKDPFPSPILTSLETTSSGEKPTIASASSGSSPRAERRTSSPRSERSREVRFRAPQGEATATSRTEMRTGRTCRGSDEAAPPPNRSARLRRLSTSVLSPSSSRASGQGIPLRMEFQFGRTEKLRSSSRVASPDTSAAPVTVYPP